MRHKWNGSTIVIELDADAVFWLNAALQRAHHSIQASVGYQYLEIEGGRTLEDWAAREAMAERRAAGEAGSFVSLARESLDCELSFLEAVRALLEGLSAPAAEAWNGRSSARIK